MTGYEMLCRKAEIGERFVKSLTPNARRLLDILINDLGCDPLDARTITERHQAVAKGLLRLRSMM